MGIWYQKNGAGDIGVQDNVTLTVKKESDTGYQWRDITGEEHWDGHQHISHATEEHARDSPDAVFNFFFTDSASSVLTSLGAVSLALFAISF